MAILQSVCGLSAGIVKVTVGYFSPAPGYVTLCKPSQKTNELTPLHSFVFSPNSPPNPPPPPLYTPATQANEIIILKSQDLQDSSSLGTADSRCSLSAGREWVR